MREVSARTRVGGRAGMLLTGLAASFALILAALGGGPAEATPTQDDIDEARAQVNYAEMSVGQLEVQLAEASNRASEAQIEAALAAEDALEARLTLDDATKAAEAAQKEAQKAEDAFLEALGQFAGVAQLTFRGGSGSLNSLSAYLEADGLETVERARAVQAAADVSADNQMQQVAALEQVARVTGEAAESAKQAEEEAYGAAQKRADDAADLLEEASRVVAEVEAEREAMVVALADLRQTTVEMERERAAEIERQREIRAAQELEQNTPSQPTPPSTGSSNPGSSSSGGSSSGGSSSGTAGSGGSSSGGSSSGTAGSGGSSSGGSSSGTTGSGGSSSGGSSTPPPVSSGGSPYASSVIAFARSQIGKPYVWAAEGPNSYDCSGLVTAAYRSVGVSVPHYTGSQYAMATKVPYSQRQPGDLIFWAENGSIYHVAIYLGNNQVIHAPRPGKNVEIVGMYNQNKIVGYVGRI